MSCNPLERTVLGFVGQTAVLIWMLSGFAFAQSGSRSRTPAVRRTAPPVAATPSVGANQGIAVVELFTSQGCSSCPSADAALQTIASVASKGKLPVHVLSFHVDYWNRLGWTDPYSDATYSQRQRAYASAVGSTRVYTPQMIVNGTTEFLGSDRSKAHAAITKSLSQKALAGIKVKIERDQPTHQIRVQYNVSGNARGSVLNLAAIQNPKANSIPRGENSGRNSSHVNVVRAFNSVPLQQPAGSANLQVPDDVELSDLRLIAYVQNPKTLAVLGATESN